MTEHSERLVFLDTESQLRQIRLDHKSICTNMSEMQKIINNLRRRISALEDFIVQRNINVSDPKDLKSKVKDFKLKY